MDIRNGTRGTPPVSSWFSSKLPLPLCADVRLYIPMTHHNDVTVMTDLEGTNVRHTRTRLSYCHLISDWTRGRVEGSVHSVTFKRGCFGHGDGNRRATCTQIAVDSSLYRSKDDKETNEKLEKTARATLFGTSAHASFLHPVPRIRCRRKQGASSARTLATLKKTSKRYI